MNIVFIAFNYEHAGKVVNGPGMCLKVLVDILNKDNILNVSVFAELPSTNKDVARINDRHKLIDKIKNADIVIHWSGLTNQCFHALKIASLANKRIILGPNLIDAVEFDKEINFIKDIKFEKILTVNERLKYLICKKHNIPQSIIDVLMIGPDLNIWTPSKICDSTILWKGNSNHFVKDVEFALKLQQHLNGKYNFKFIGYPNTYSYEQHIADAVKSKLYITTSISETMGMALLESWASGIPSVTHPKIYMHGINYETGIITNRTIPDYAEAIDEIMQNDALYTKMKHGARKFMEDNFSREVILKNFKKVIK